MSVSVVNGFVCFNCTDTEKAQKGIDPANPARNPKEQEKQQLKKAEAKAAQDRLRGLGNVVDVTA